MSIALMTLAWKSGLPAGRKMVLLALCDNANEAGECFPSISMLAEKCSMGERTVQQHITDMEASGILKRVLRAGRSTMYYIDPRRICAPADFAPPQILHPTPAESAPPPPQISHPTPADFAPITIKESSVEPSGNHQKRGKTAPAYEPLGDLLTRGVDEQTASDWLTHRKAKKAAVSKTVHDAIAREAEKAGVSLADALQMACMRGWQGFKADWVQQPRAGPAGPSQLGKAGQATAAAAQRLREKLKGQQHGS